MKHGTNRAYDVHRCRCEECRAFKSGKDRRRRERRKQQSADGELNTPHGTPIGYDKYYCRCEGCLAANRIYMRNFATATPRWVARAQAETLATAASHGNPWTGPELELVTRRDLSTVQLAQILGRTWAAVNAARQRAEHDPKWARVAGVSKDA